MRKALILAIVLSGCANSHHSVAASDSPITAIYSPPVRLGGTGSVIFMPAPPRVPEAAVRGEGASGDASRPLSVTQQMPPPPQSDCFVPGPWIVFFKMDQVELNSEAKVSLASLLRRERDACGKFNVNIEGHIHAREPQTLSRKRAEAVRRYLLEQEIGVSMNVKDMGSREPRVPNLLAESIIHNPRVEVHAH